MQYIVYKITNTITGLSYIGYTGNSLKRRFSQHWKSAYRKNRKSITKLASAIREYYDRKLWIIEIIEQNIDFIDVHQKECDYIKLFDTFNNGYNSNEGGGGLAVGTYKHPPEMIEHLRKINLGKTLSQEHKDKCSKSHTGKKLPESQKRKIAEKCGPQGAAHFKSRIEEHRKEMTGHEYNALIWKVTDPTGNEFEIKNMKKFCRENNLQSCGMYNVYAGRCTNHKGWKCIKVTGIDKFKQKSRIKEEIASEY